MRHYCLTPPTACSIIIAALFYTERNHMPRLLPALVGEAIGVFALSFVGILAIHELGSVPGGLIGIALAPGLHPPLLIPPLAPRPGGHFNPRRPHGLLVGGQIK